MDGGENTYGGCESLNAVHTKLKPSGGHGFIIKKKSRHALISWNNKGYAEWARTACGE